MRDSLPKKGNEAYSYVPLRDLNFLHLPSVPSSSVLKTFPSQFKHYLIVDNGILRTDLSNLPDGIEATSSQWDNLNSLEQEQLFKENDYGALQALANSSSIIKIRVKTNQIIKDVINICQTNHTQSRIDLCYLMKMEDNSQVSFYNHYQTQYAHGHLNLYSKISVQKNSFVNWINYQDYQLTSSLHHKYTIDLQRDASWIGISLGVGSLHTREAVEANLNEEQAHFQWKGISKLNQSHKLHRHIVVNHLNHSTTSNQHFKNVLDDDSISSVDGLIQIKPKLENVNSNQLINNLLLSHDCKANNKPSLKIQTDDVKCSHGVTVGQIDPEQIFYLQSRGISAKQASKMLTQSFIQEVLNEIPIDQIRQFITREFA